MTFTIDGKQFTVEQLEGFWAGVEYENQRIAKRIISEIKAEECDCGLLCEGWNNGMEYALSIMQETEDDWD